MGRGGGGVWFVWERRARCSVWRVVRDESRVLSGEEMAFEVGSICRGRRVNVSSIVVVVVEAGVKPTPSSAEYVAAALQCAPYSCRDQRPTGSTEVAPGRVRSI